MRFNALEGIGGRPLEAKKERMLSGALTAFAKAELTEKTLVEPQGGIEVETGIRTR